MKDFKDYYKELLTNTSQTDTESSPSIVEDSKEWKEHHKILRDNERGRITPKEKEYLRKLKAELDKIKPKYPPGQDPGAHQNRKD